MRVHVYPGDTGGCGHYRLAWPAEVLAERGHDISVFFPGVQSTLPVTMIRSGNQVRCRIDQHPGCDILVIQRPLDWRWTLAIPELRKIGVRVVADIDDNFHAMHGSHSGYYQVHPRTSPEHNFEHLARALNLVDLVTVTTPTLAARYGRHGRCVIIPNSVPTAFLRDRTPNDRPVIGWPGATDTHPDDLRVVGPAVANQVRAGVEFKVVGKPEGVARDLKIPDDGFTLHPWVPMSQYPAALATIDVGIVPLQPNQFNEAKSALKGLEMAACHVPFVASATYDYRRLAAEGAGILAERPKDWDRALRSLVASAAMREDVADRGFAAASAWTIEAQAWRWEEAWLGRPEAVRRTS
jgi:Glycosyl transferases group 1